MSDFSHIPVLLSEVVACLAPCAGEIYVDATFGGGGYAKAILDGANCRLLGIDRDFAAIERAQSFQKNYADRFFYRHGKFSDFPSFLDQHGIDKVDGIIFDLGVSSYQIDDPERGFSFRFNAPLSMAMGCNDLSAYDVVNHYSENELIAIFKKGEEPFAKRIAKKIVETRVEKPIESTSELAALIASCRPSPKDAQHPATLAFQALRIFINEELIEIEKALELCKKRLKPGGRLIVVTFHSLEDRIVKDFIRKESGHTPLPSRHMPFVEADFPKPTFSLKSKKAIIPTEDELRKNPRARSAKLRYAIRVGD